MPTYDVVVLGAGPGGYACAIRCAQLGLRTAIVERASLGGVCLNLGCIPSKAMLRSAEILGLIRSADEFGIEVGEVSPRYGAMVARRDQVVARLRQGLTNLIRSNGIDVIQGEGRLLHAQALATAQDNQEIGFRSLVIATGSSSSALPVPGGSLPGVIDSDQALALQQAPARAVAIGAGPVGVEWAEVWRAFGTEVALVEMQPQILPTEDGDVARELARAFTQKGVECLTATSVREIRPANGALEVVAATDSADRLLPADTVLVAVGRRPNLSDLNLEAVGLGHDHRGIATDGHMRTSVPNIYAVGDVAGQRLAHVATHQGIIAAETIAGHNPEPFDERLVPGAIFTHPEVASIGLRERDARAQSIPVTIGRFPLLASGRAAASGDTGGFVKIIAEESSRRVLGVHIVGPGAADLMGEASLALRLGATIDDLSSTIHVHPTFSEGILEAAWVAAGTPLHISPRRATAAS